MNLSRIAIAGAIAVASLSSPSSAIANPPPPSQPVGGDVALPRSVTYAGTHWTIESAEFAPGGTDGAPSIRLGFSVVNRLDDYGINVPVELLAVATPDGSLVRATTLEGTTSEYRVELEPGTDAAGTAVFNLTATDADVDLAASSFVIDEPGRTPAVLPLGGPILANPYPITITAAGSSGPIPGTCFDGIVEIAVTGATVSLDLGPQRADEDQRFLSVHLHISAVSGSIGMACVDGPFLRLVTGTARREPVDGTEVYESLDVGATLDTVVTFAVPVDATAFELGIGANGATVAAIPIAIAPDLVDVPPTAETGAPTS